LQRLIEHAQRDGVDLSVVSGYRSYQTQQTTYDYWLSQNGGNVDFVDKISARAGHSEHQLGTVVDFSSSEVGDALGNRFNNSQTNIWLAENAPLYGFRLSYPQGKESETGYNYEGWHYRYYGAD
jgi:zinc D-Ala-D-Ala carboxypeptidase